ncbi:uracil phosphoribosyltransferase-domain-containing protein [Pisolithus microcarpus]|nr:uracil phosphoribosyltransferase-domain-containing protein [Pisolithus microcarpus]
MSQNRHVLSHPLGIYDISLVLGIEATRDLEEDTFDGQTPIGPFTGSIIKPRIGLTPILRAGLGMTDALLTLFPKIRGLVDYSKLPSVPNVDICFLLDPLVATGGTACAALSMLLDWGIPLNKIKLLVVLGSDSGLTRIEESYPGLEIWVAAVDPNLTNDGLIYPGLGDAGDRLFNTVRE